MLDWNDLRHFLAVARTGSTLAAGRSLRVSQTTAARRVAALEAELGLTLFERRPGGYRLTPIGEALVEKAESVEASAQAFAEAAASQSREVSGTVRLTLEEIFAVTLLPPILRDLHDAHPGIRIELDTSEALRDLAGGAADVALRSVGQLTGNGLVGRRLATAGWAIYCSRDYAAAHGRPRSRKQLRGHPLIGGGGPGVWQAYRAWLERNNLVEAVTMQHGSTSGLLAAVRAGSGLAVLPTLIADLDPDLLQCLPPKPDHDVGLWLVTHERLRHTPRVRAVMDFLGERLTRLAKERDRAVEAAA
jgi:DNA-binding transcriptional LysR family regulator